MDPYEIEVFRTGTHTAMNGQTKTYTKEDLEGIVTQYNGQEERKAPLVLGHPELDSPAFGWIDKLAMRGERMIAYVSQVNEKVKDAVKAGMFKTVSIALFADGLLRHIGLLGAAPPAIAGLAPVQFSADVEYLEFAWATDEWRMPTVASLLRGLRDWIIGEKSLEVADQVLPSGQIDLLTGTAPTVYIPNAEVNGFSRTTQEVTDMDEKKFNELKAQVAAMAIEFAATKAELTETKTALAAAENKIVAVEKRGKADVAVAQFSAFIDGLIRDGKVLPAEKEPLEGEFTDIYMANSQLQFAAGQKDLVAKFQDRLAARPVVVKILGKQFATHESAAPTTGASIGSEFANVVSQIDLASVDQDAQIMAYAAEHKCSYEQAVTGLYGG